MWSVCGVYVEFMWSVCGISGVYVELKWSNVESMWTLNGMWLSVKYRRDLTNQANLYIMNPRQREKKRSYTLHESN
jgi:hypothetical protein